MNTEVINAPTKEAARLLIAAEMQEIAKRIDTLMDHSIKTGSDVYTAGLTWSIGCLSALNDLRESNEAGHFGKPVEKLPVDPHSLTPKQYMLRRLQLRGARQPI